MCTVYEVADYFLRIPEDDAGDAISPMKLQKLLYYAQGFSLALLNHPLFEEDFEAWTYGPVIPTVYAKYKQYGNNAIPRPESFDRAVFTDEEIRLLDEVYDAFGQYSAWALSELTHKTPPWRDTPPTGVISKKAMSEYFITQVAQ